MIYRKRKAVTSHAKVMYKEPSDPVFEENKPEQGPKTNMIERVKGAWNALTMPPDDGMEVFHDDNRTEPEFNPSIGNQSAEFITAPEMAPSYGEEIFSSGDVEFEKRADFQMPVYNRNTAEAAQTRVVEPTPPPKPGNRVVREAQPSLLDSDCFELPHLEFLGEPKNVVQDSSLSSEALEANARLLEGVLEDFGVKGEIIKVHPGPVVTLYELEPAPGIKSSRVIGLADDIARSMSAIACRVAVVPGRNAIGIEMPNQRRERSRVGRQSLNRNGCQSSRRPLGR